MGFPLPAADYVETRISLDQQLIRHPRSDLFHAGIAFTFQGGNTSRGAACCECATYCL